MCGKASQMMNATVYLCQVAAVLMPLLEARITQQNIK